MQRYRALGAQRSATARTDPYNASSTRAGGEPSGPRPLRGTIDARAPIQTRRGCQVFLTTFMQAGLRGVSTETVAADYADWALGLAGPPLQRRTRLEQGVVERWTPDMLLASQSLVGTVGCRVEMRLDPDRMLFRFAHRDQLDGSVFWHSAAHARRVGDALVVEHAVAREAPRGAFLNPVASPSRVVLGLFDRRGVEVEPRDLLLDPVHLTQEDEVRRFVHYVLTRKDRLLPFLVVACARNGGPPLVDPQQLGRRLRGICAVATLATQDATYEFSNSMADAGFGQMFRCYHGAIHVYGPTASMQQDHRLWLGDGLADIPTADRVERIAGMIAGRIAVRDTPRGFFTQIEEHDRELRRTLALKLSEKRSTPPPPHDAVPKDFVARVEQERQELQDALRRSVESEKAYEAEWIKADEARQEAQCDRDQAEAELEQERAVSQALREEMAEQKVRAPVAAMSGDLRVAIEAVLNDRPTPQECMVLV